MKNVLLLGDSIRRGYDKAVQKSLENVANVIYPEDNCRFAAYLLRYFGNYIMDINGEDIDVIHWNTGLWDCLHLYGDDALTPYDVYAHYIERICVTMKKLCPNAKIIFATSTSVISEKMQPDFKRYNHETEQYNAIAVDIVKKHGFEVNDLYALSVSLPDEAHSDPTHYYTPMGTEAFTNQVLKYLAQALELETVPQYCEELHTDKPVGV